MEKEEQRPLGTIGILPRWVGVFAGVVTRLGTEAGGACVRSGKAAGGWTKGLLTSRKKECEEAPAADEPALEESAVEAPEPTQVEMAAAVEPEPEPEPEPLENGTEKDKPASI